LSIVPNEGVIKPALKESNGLENERSKNDGPLKPPIVENAAGVEKPAISKPCTVATGGRFVGAEYAQCDGSCPFIPTIVVPSSLLLLKYFSSRYHFILRI
jgi:hypothetical protein